MMIIVIGKAIAKPGCEAEVLGHSLAHVARSRGEDGCIDHTVSVDQENPRLFRFVEYWRDRNALRAHFAVPESRVFVASLIPLLSEAPDMQIYDLARIAL